MRVFRLFQHHVALSTLLELLADSLLCYFAAVFVFSALPGGRADAAAVAVRLDQAPWVHALGFAAAMLLLYAFVGLYRQAAVEMGFGRVVRRAILALVIGAYIAYVVLASDLDGQSATYLVVSAMLYLLVGLVAVRLGISLITRLLGVPRVLIVGTGAEAWRVAQDLQALQRLERRLVGFYPTGERDGRLGGMRVFERSEPLEDLVERLGVDEIIVAAKEQRGGGVPIDQLLACRIRGVPILDMSGFYERVKAEVPIDSLKASWLVYSQGFVQGPARRAAKRVFDILTSSVLLVLAAPVMVLTALAIKLDSPGPVIYRQERVGLGGRRFMCLKFRSMTVDAEKDGVARWASKNDARVTRVGRFIRKTRIDELPQLLSVLKGEMSMVGPRPERPSFVEELKQHIPFYDLRHSVKPGVTGWAQVRYSYGASLEDARRKHQFDLYYVKNNSLFLDVLVLIETVSVVLFREGAR